MSYTPNQPQPPIIIFMDGSEFEVLRSNKTIKDGQPALELSLSPFEWVIAMLQLDPNNDLDYSTYAYGVMQRTYFDADIIKVSENPEKPIWWGLCTVDGVSMLTSSEHMNKVLSAVEDKKKLTVRVRVLEAEVKRLQKENLNYAMKAREFFATQQELTRPQSHVMLPGTSSEVKIKSEQPESGGP